MEMTVWRATQPESNFCRLRKPCYAAAMAFKPRVAIAGREDWAPPWRRTQAGGYRISEIVSRNSLPPAARRVYWRTKYTRVAPMANPRLDAALVWFCVPDREIAKAARQLAPITDWKGKITRFIPAGALASDELQALRRRGAAWRPCTRL